MKTGKITRFGLLLAIAFIFSYIESLIPTPPGVKLGIANLIVIFALYLMGKKEAFILSILRILLVGITFGNLYSMIYSLVGGMISLIAMILIKNSKHFGTLGVSVAGGVTHNLGQILVAALIVKNVAVVYYYPLLLLSGIIAGVVVGVLSSVVIARLSGTIK